MTEFHYRPASPEAWLVVAREGRLVAIAVGADGAGAYADAVAAAPSIDRVIEALATDGLAAIPDFVIVDAGTERGRITVLVRGSARVSVARDGASLEWVDAGGVTTWTERSFASGATISFGDRGETLPLASGAAWASGVEATFSELAADRAPADVADAAGGSAAATTEAAPDAVGPDSASLGAADSAPALATTDAPQIDAALANDAGATAPDADDSPPADDAAGGYDYLFGDTVFRPVHAAAVPVPSPDGADDDPGESTPDGARQEPLGPDADTHADTDTDTHADADADADTDAGTGAATVSAETTIAPPTDDTPVQVVTSEPVGVRSTAPAAAVISAAPQATAASSHDTGGDHDGQTVVASRIRAARTEARRRAEAERPRFVLALPGGGRHSLDAPVILGRAPSVSHVPSSVLPALVTIVGDDISRTHVRVAIEGDTVVVTDLHSSNGTRVVSPGKAPRSLRAGEPTPVMSDTVIDLGGVELRVEEG